MLTRFACPLQSIASSSLHDEKQLQSHSHGGIQVVDAGGETTFDVVFLPRQEGVFESTLYVRSSLGMFTYTVSPFLHAGLDSHLPSCR
jgi:hypothetical protein